MSEIRRKKVNFIGFLISAIITGIIMFALLNRIPIYGIASNVLVIIPEGKSQSYAQHITGNIAGIIQNAFDDGKIAGIPTEIVVKKLKDSGVIKVSVYQKDATEAFKMHKLLMNSIEKEVRAFYPKSMGVEIRPVGQSYKIIRLPYIIGVIIFSIILGWLLSLYISELVESVFSIKKNDDEEYEELYSKDLDSNNNLRRNENFISNDDDIYNWSDLKNNQNYKYTEENETGLHEDFEKQFENEKVQEEMEKSIEEKERENEDLTDNFQNLNEQNVVSEIEDKNTQNYDSSSYENNNISTVLEEGEDDTNKSFKNKISNFRQNLKKSVENIKKENKKLNFAYKKTSTEEDQKNVDDFFEEEIKKTENKKTEVLEDDLNLINSQRNAEYLNSLGPLGASNKKGDVKVSGGAYEYIPKDYEEDETDNEQIKEIRTNLSNNLASLNKVSEDVNKQKDKDLKKWSDVTNEVNNQFRGASLSEGEELNLNKNLPLEEIVHTDSNITGEVDENLFADYKDVETLGEQEEKVKRTLTGGFALPQIEEKYTQVKNTQKELNLETEEQTKNQSSGYTNVGSTNSIPANLPIVEINDTNEASTDYVDKEGAKMVEDFEKEPSDEELKRRLNELLNGSI